MKKKNIARHQGLLRSAIPKKTKKMWWKAQIDFKKGLQKTYTDCVKTMEIL